MDKPMDPAKALPIERINDLLDPGYHEVGGRMVYSAERRRVYSQLHSHAGRHRRHGQLVVCLALASKTCGTRSGGPTAISVFP